MMNTEAKLSINGHITIFQRDGSIDTILLEKDNKFQVGGKEAIVNCLAYGTNISHIAMLYSSASSPSAIGASGGTLTWGDFVTRGSTSGNGLILCPAFMIGVSETFTTSATGINNTAAFVGLSDSGTRVVGMDLATGHKVYAVGLVQAPPSSISSLNHVLYAAADITPLSKAANSQIGIRWATTITVS
jgi:hypothetical protein